MKKGVEPFLVFLVFLVAIADSARDVFMLSASDAEGNLASIFNELEKLSEDELPPEGFPTDFCLPCLEFSRTAEKYLSDPSVFDKIDNLVSIFCGMGPSVLETKCIEVMEMHKHEAVVLLQEVVTEEKFCNGTGFCPDTAQESSLSASSKAESLSAMGHLSEMMSKLQKILPMEVVDRFLSSWKSLKSNKAPLELSSNKTCNGCLNVLNKLRNELEDPDKQLKIITSLLKACESDVFVYRCKKLVFAYGPIVISNLERIVNMDLCHLVHICRHPKNQTISHMKEKFLPFSVAKLDLM